MESYLKLSQDNEVSARKRQTEKLIQVMENMDEIDDEALLEPDHPVMF